MKPNESRNRELVHKRLSNPSKWSFGELGRHYNIDKTTAEDIFKRDISKYSTKAEVALYKAMIKGINRRGELSTVRS